MVKAHERWRDSGFEILAFPCNQFFSQESGTPEEIDAFVKNNFKASFPIMEKVEVNGENTHPLFVYLRNNSSLYDPATKTSKVIPWNFAKFFVDSKGQVIQFFAPTVKAEEVTAYIEKKVQEK
jgi:glutathione peroxidase